MFPRRRELVKPDSLRQSGGIFPCAHSQSKQGYALLIAPRTTSLFARRRPAMLYPEAAPDTYKPELS
jgi:hypothetical protein